MTALDVLSMIRQAGGSIVAEDGDLRIKAPRGLLKPEHKAVLAEYKADLVRLLDPVFDHDEHLDPWEEAIDPPAPCGQCGGLELWENLVGDWRCLKCDPPIRGQRCLAAAERLRRLYRRSRS